MCEACSRAEKIAKVESRNLTHLFNDRENPWLAIVVAVGSDAEIDLLREGICLVGGGELENATARREGDSSGVGAGLPIRGSQWYNIPRLC